MSFSSLWVAAPDYLPWLVVVGLPVVGAQATVVAVEIKNQIFASGASAAAPDAGPEVEQSSGAFPPPVSDDCWAAGAKDPQPLTPGGPTQF